MYAHQSISDGVGLAVAEVGSYLPNSWGIHDMLGNVSEICADYYKMEIDGGADPLDQYLQSDRKIHQRHGVYRGGSWCTTINNINRAYRGFFVSRAARFVGVRLVIRKGNRKALTNSELLDALKKVNG